jgi:energy-converting hydrogenase B subunit G
MDYDSFQKKMEKSEHGDGISVGAGLTGEFTLYGFLVLSIILLFRLFSDILFALMGISVMGIILSFMPILFKFNDENSNHINMQLFWISIFVGILSVIIYFAK